MSVRAIVVVIMMLLAVVLGRELKPTERLSTLADGMRLETAIPKSFGAWRIDATADTEIVDPSLTEVINRIYSDTVSRIYTDASGYRVMLSVAYGSDQSHDLQVHRPEVCYPAQGYTVSELKPFSLALADRDVLATRMKTANAGRIEPVTYWIRIGEKTERGSVDQGLTRLQYGLRGYRVDGLVFRVSSIDDDTERAYSRQEAFVDNLVAALAPGTRKFLLGGRDLTTK